VPILAGQRIDYNMTETSSSAFAIGSQKFDSFLPVTWPIGTQIAYIPTHAEGDIRHPDVEFGFTTSLLRDDGTIFCRYWRKGHIGELRTTANSENTRAYLLTVFHSIDDRIVDGLLEELGYA